MKETGKVWLAGAGPGDEGLLTVKTRQVMDEADVVVYDALVSMEILSQIPVDKEMIYVCTLNGHGEPVAMEMVAKGGVNYCHVDMAQIYKTAIISSAAGIICFHNHPSGSIEPSKEDRLLTEKMKTAGRYLDIPLRDHIIIGGDGAFYSFNENETEYSYE